jgi:hypothetical protein
MQRTRFCGFTLDSLPIEKENCCAFYVGVAVYGTPQEWLREALLFGVATVFGVCFGVACEFSSTRTTYLHVESVGVWMWEHAGTLFLTQHDTALASGESLAFCSQDRVIPRFFGLTNLLLNL